MKTPQVKQQHDVDGPNALRSLSCLGFTTSETLMGHIKDNPNGKDERLFSYMADSADNIGNGNDDCHAR